MSEPSDEVKRAAAVVDAYLKGLPNILDKPAAPAAPAPPPAPAQPAAPSRPETAEARFRRTQTGRPDVPVARPDWRDPRG
jgi:hypothetical protein